VDSTVRYWDSTDYSVISSATFPPSGESPLCICFLNDIVLTGWTDGSVRSVDTETGEVLWSIKQAHRGPLTVLKSGNNAKFFVTGGQDGQVRVWAVKTRELVSSFKEHHAAITDLVVMEDDAHVMSSSKDKCIFCWDLRRERRISCHEHRMGGVNGLVICNDQTTIISVGTNKQITYWDIRQPESVRIVEYSKSKSFEPTCIAISHDNAFFAVGGTDEDVNFYETKTGTKLAVGKGHSGVVSSLKFSPDDKQLVSVAQDGCIFVFNIFDD
jgi:WD40 repeat protein